MCGDCNAKYGVSGIWVIHIGPKSGCKLSTLFGSDCDDGVSAGPGIWVIHNIQVPNLGQATDTFWQ